jgi:uncharacterized protein (TIGR03067 family)
MRTRKALSLPGLGLTVTVAALTAAGPTARAGDGDKGPEALVGGYTIVSGERDGRPEPEERVKGTTAQFSVDRVVVVDKDKKEVYGAAYTLDTSRTPWRITMTSKLGQQEGEVARGLIEKKGDTLRLIYALPGGGEPTDFHTKDKQLMFVMKTMSK